TMLLSGIMLKMGIYSVLRWIIPIVPEAVETHTPLIIALSITGVVYGAWIAIKQKDLKTLFAFASMSHVGLIVAGLFTASESGLQGVLFQSFSHGINAIGLFYVADIVQNRFGNRTIDGKGGIRLAAPVFATLFVLVLLGTVALPLTNGFAGEFLLLVGISEYSIAASAVAGLTVIFSAVYMLRSYQHLVLGPAGTQTAFSDLRLTEMVILAVIVVAIFALGVYPKALLDLSAPTIQTLLNR
ncbi:MAG TPA: proton-conducting transporter membrane subunit, partial [Luteibaculaceae bacterium]|nr:proton-conducting transporter membrane subunit [Luteibaculaceae bacterium]